MENDDEAERKMALNRLFLEQEGLELGPVPDFLLRLGEKLEAALAKKRKGSQ